MIKPDKIIRSKRKTFSLQINEEGNLIVRVPKFVSDYDILKFVEKHESWIKKRVNELQSKKALLKPHRFEEGEEFLLLNKKYFLRTFELTSTSMKKSRTVFINDEYLMIDKSNTPSVSKIIEKFYKEEAGKILLQKVKTFLKKFNDLYGYNFSFRNIRLTNAKKIIGSCSPKGDLNFSWRIIQAPEDVIDYIVIHEIVHLKEKNHKKNFWLKVSNMKPDYKDAIMWLKNNWFYLRNFLVE